MVDEYGNHDEQADDRLVIVIGDASKCETVSDHANDEAAKDGAENTAFAAVQAGATNHASRNDFELEPKASVRVDRRKAADLDQPG